MRIVVDLQGAQSESRFRGIGRYTLSFVKAILRNRNDHEIIIALNGLFNESIGQIRNIFKGLIPQANIVVWNSISPVSHDSPKNIYFIESSEYLRESFLLSLKPDVIVVSSVFEGFSDNSITSIKKFDLKTPVAAIGYDLIPLYRQNEYLNNQDIREFYFKKLDYLKKADAILSISEFVTNQLKNSSLINSEKIFTVGAAVESFFCKIISTNVAPN